MSLNKKECEDSTPQGARGRQRHGCPAEERQLAILKSWQMTIVREDAEKSEPVHCDGNVTWCSRCGKQPGASSNS